MMYRRTGFLAVLALCLMCFLSACKPMSGPAEGQLYVVATTSIITDLVQKIGGEHIYVAGLMGPGVDPHLYRATAHDVIHFSKADIIYYNGLHLEAKLGDILDSMGQTKTTVAVTRSIPEERLFAFAGYPGYHDPHLWFDVSLWIYAIDEIRDSLIDADRKHAEYYRKRAAAYAQELRTLHQKTKEAILTIPLSRRVLITAHDAFQYFGQAYSIEVKGLQGISTDSQAGTKDVQDLAAYIADKKIPAIFVESSIPKRTIVSVQRAVEARGWDVVIGGELFSDAMGNPDTPEGTYVGMVNHNVNTIVNALK